MSKIDKTKTVLKFIVGTSTSFTVRRALINNVEPENIREKAELTIGAVAVGGVAAEASEAWIDRVVDSIVEAINNIKKAN